MKRSTMVLATISLGAMLAAGSATASMARTRHHAAGHNAAGLGGGNFDFHLGLQDPWHDRGAIGDSGYHDKTWWNYNTDAAYCSFDAVLPYYESFAGPNGVRTYCP